jgi:hypothetical protein
MVAAYELGANAGEFPLAPLGMEEEHGFGDHETEDGISQELKPLVIAGGDNFIGAAFEGTLMGEGAVGQGADEQFEVGKAIPQSRFQFT